MKKFGLLLAGGIAAIVLLSNLGSMVGLAITLALLYFIVKHFLKTKSTGKKIVLGIIGLMVLSATFHHVPALIGVAAAAVLYLVYKKWNEDKDTFSKKEESDDPFANFEKQWNELKH